jgi:hypothetical protein
LKPSGARADGALCAGVLTADEWELPRKEFGSAMDEAVRRRHACRYRGLRARASSKGTARSTGNVTHIKVKVSRFELKVSRFTRRMRHIEIKTSHLTNDVSRFAGDVSRFEFHVSRLTRDVTHLEVKVSRSEVKVSHAAKV